MIIEDMKDQLEALVDIIDGEKDFRCVGAYRDCTTALKNIGEDTPDVVLLDIKLPGMLGYQAIRKIKQKVPDVKIIMMTVHRNDDWLRDSLKAGALGYLLKDIDPADLIAAIKDVKNGGAPLSKEAAVILVKSLHEEPREIQISKREKQVLDRICDGKTAVEIAGELEIKPVTVKFHRQNLYLKFDVPNKAALVREAVKMKLC